MQVLTQATEIIARLHTFPDDGHAIKLGRATVVCHNICKKYEAEGKDWLIVKGDDMWKTVCHLIVDSVEAPGEHWVRSCGFEEAWKVCSDVPLAEVDGRADWHREFRTSESRVVALSFLKARGPKPKL
jgi:hypothetical protein